MGSADRIIGPCDRDNEYPLKGLSLIAMISIILVLSMCLTEAESQANVSDPNSIAHENDDDEGCCEVVKGEVNFLKSQLQAQKLMLESLHEKVSTKACPSGFDFVRGANGCFKVIFQRLSWQNATSKCRQVMPGVHLAAITSAEKQNAIEAFLQAEFNSSENSSLCQRNLERPDHLGKSVWTSGQTRDPHICGSPYDWKTLNGIDIPFNYTNWNKREPNCAGYENCAHIVAGYKYRWNDLNCNTLICALCEF